MKVGPVGAMRTDGGTDRQIRITKLIVAFCNVANEPKIHRKNYTLILRRLINFSFCALIFMLSACSPPKCCLSCPHHIKGCVGLIYLVVLQVGGEKLN